MDRSRLRDNGITFQEDPDVATNQPPHVSALRVALLDFDCAISRTLDLSTDEALEACDCASNAPVDERRHARGTLRECQKLRETAKKLHDGIDSEEEWRTFFLDFFFSPLAEEMTAKDTDTRR